MKTTKMLGATTLAGALLFTGVNAHAAESQVTSDNAVNIATDVMKKAGQSPENVNFRNAEDKGDYYFISYNNKSGVGDGGTRVYKDGRVESASGVLGANDDKKAEFEKDGQYEFANAQNNGQQSQATDNDVATQNNTQQTQGNDNTADQNNTQAQSEAQTLPETGETSNTTLVTMVAAVMLAAGSLLTFKRFSKDNK